MNSTHINRRQLLQFAGLAAAVPLTSGIANAVSRSASAPRRLVLIAGTPSHGPGDHEFNAGVQLLAECLKGESNLNVIFQLNGYPKDESVLDGADAIVLFADGGGGHPFIQEQRIERINELAARGVGIMCMHYAVEVPKDKGADEMRSWIGGAYEHAWSCNPMWEPEFTTFPKHPICNGVKPFSVRDEWYFNMRFRPEMAGVTPLLTAIPSDAVRNGPYVYPQGPYEHIQAAKGRSETMMWCTERDDGGRGVGFTGGHVHRNWGNESFRKVILNALLWVSKVDVPENGVETQVSEEMLASKLDPKPPRK